MNRGLSLYLDILRFGAALVVLITHLAYTELSGGMLAYWRLLGNDAVMIFFVLSGFVIAYATEAKETTPGAYIRSRLARLWSVAVPALLITIALDHWGSRIDPVAYSQWWYQGSDPLWRSLRALTFTNEVWFSGVRPFSNGPWWSLGYEAFYYAIFAALLFIPGWKGRVAAGALLLIAGPPIILLWPVWWLGVWTFRHIRRKTLPADKSALLFFGSLAVYALFRWSGAPVILKALTALTIGPENVGHYLRFSDEFLSSYLIGPMVAAHFIGAHGLSAALESLLTPWRKVIVWFAQSTFALYLLHYPMLRFVRAAFAYDAHNPWHVAAVFLGVTGTCVLIGPLIERTKGLWKALLSPHGQRQRITA